MHLIVQMRPRTSSCTTHTPNHFTSYDSLAELRPKIFQVCIHCFVSETVINNNCITISTIPSHFNDYPVARCVHIRSRMSREIHSPVKLSTTINRINAHPISRCRLPQFLVSHRLNGRNTL